MNEQNNAYDRFRKKKRKCQFSSNEYSAFQNELVIREIIGEVFHREPCRITKKQNIFETKENKVMQYTCLFSKGSWKCRRIICKPF